MEIETLFAKYDIDGDRALNLEEQKKMFEDMAHESEEIRKALKELEATSDQLAFLLLSICWNKLFLTDFVKQCCGQKECSGCSRYNS